MNNSPFPQSDDRLLSYLLHEIKDEIFSNPKKPQEGEEKIIFVLLGLIAIICTEPFKILLRRNIGKLSLSLPRLVLASILYILWGVLLCVISTQTSDYTRDSIFQPAMLIVGIFYIAFGILVSVLGGLDYSKAQDLYNKDHSDPEYHVYRGDSIFFGYLLKKGWKHEKIWLRAEGMFCMVITLLVTLVPFIVDPWFILFGVPLLVTSLSFIFNESFQIKNVWGVTTKKIIKEKIKMVERINGRENDRPFSSAQYGN